MEKHTATFQAQSNNGHEYTIFEFTNLVDAGTMGDPNAVIPGLKRFCTADGDSVNRTDKGKYMIVDSGMELFSDDPDAP